MLNDLRFALRQLLKSPGFTAVAVLTLALGIGANTALFTVMNALLVRPLPYVDADRIGRVWERTPAAGQEDLEGVSPPTLQDWQREAHSFEALAGYFFFLFNVSGEREPEAVNGTYVSASLFPLFQVAPTHGRLFTDAADQPNPASEVIISDSLWRRRFNADATVIGRSLQIDGVPHTIVGVLPPTFLFPLAPPRGMTLPRFHGDLFLPLGSSPIPPVRGAHALNVLGRLKTNVTWEQASGELAAVTRGIQAQHPELPSDWVPQLKPLREFLFGEARPGLSLLWAAVGCVLLIVCVNLASLQLARASGRTGEIAVRSALGAGRGRIIRQLMTESALVALVGGGLGVFLCGWMVRLLVNLSPGETLRLTPVKVDASVLGFALLLAVLAAVGSGLLPAWQLASRHLTEALRTRQGTGTVSQRRLRRILIVGEVALALVLLVTSGLLLRSFARVRAVEPGFAADQVLTGFFALPFSRQVAPGGPSRFYEQVIDRLETLPGVQSAAVVNALPMSGLSLASRFWLEGQPVPKPGEGLPFHMRSASHRYFETMQQPMVQGRGLAETDVAGGPLVVVVNETLARKQWPGENPIGRRLAWTATTNGPAWRTVVGVVGDVRHSGLETEPYPEIWAPHTQDPWGYMNLVVRTQGAPATYAAAVREAVLHVAVDQPVHNVRPMGDFVAAGIAQRRFTLVLLTLFGGIALLLAVMGIYGVLAHTVAQRTREIGIRLALGAPRQSVRMLVLGQGLALVGIGVVLGCLAALGFSGVLRGLLFQVGTTDPLTYAGAILLMLGAAFAACWWPARRATQVSPLVALNSE